LDGLLYCVRRTEFRAAARRPKTGVDGARRRVRNDLAAGIQGEKLRFLKILSIEDFFVRHIHEQTLAEGSPLRSIDERALWSD
jgi:hypothetical protein